MKHPIDYSPRRRSGWTPVPNVAYCTCEKFTAAGKMLCVCGHPFANLGFNGECQTIVKEKP